MNILIVDDEPRHLRGMAGMIQMMRPDAKVKTAKDGEAALALVREEQPDVVLSDIQMPKLDGLSFLQRLQEEELRTKVVMVSAYNLFEYAQRAIRHGAYDYLLKPVDMDKVEVLLQRLDQQLAEEERERGESAEIKQKLELASSAYRSRLLHQWLSGELPPGERVDLEEWPLLIQMNTLILTEIRNKGEAFPVTELVEQLKQRVSAHGEACVFPLQTVSQHSIRLVAVLKQESHSAAEIGELRSSLMKETEIWRACGTVSHGVTALQAEDRIEPAETFIPKLFRQAEEALEYAFHEEWESVVTFGHVAGLGNRNAVFQLDGEALFEALQEQSLARAEAMCREAFAELSSQGRTEPKLMKNYASLTLMKLKSRTSGIIDQQVGSALADTASTAIPSCTGSGMLIELMLGRLAEVHKSLTDRKQGSGELAVEQCLGWIQGHYAEDLTLEMAAEQFHFNPSYFSTLMKSRTGRSFSDHLTEARIRAAKELLAGGRFKIYEIAEQCGYRDTKYFTRIFKRQVGLSPEAYKHTLRPQTGSGDWS
ncbi:response regulator transcription factor [Paenibacillus sp. JDR-2]|uniref:response regulator transcription factor n=1 Tax=Paenibacillus sp. (strain JDR-2) TaxID=324057 RepID=UPI000166A2E7|nr:response regulator [Paenibacillus sp. JDR-2]ACT00119.1 two component transcriptional regulator, AraC family [Paenibacillus sp. JDR-2]